ncbi:transcription-repair coupling factor [Hwanghaeella grinnelliae]|uniref:Transcription-repair-coupling factor n=1 Tax=Hwanghaeella grinnelliae TaxID=2500179 RepID=A0A437QY16_9PROT|nr:transcription-repair coupling factor [Hwanghaeella grinnelliae]RVU39437.1 transcription-repair coupling factor [Hwanghaeella grinnelliae]
MFDLSSILTSVGRKDLGGVPDGFDALLTGRAAAAIDRPVLFIVRDDVHLSRARQLLAFAAPDLPVLTFPAWDCLPYDRVSPRGDVMAERVDTLCRIAAEPATPKIVVATLNAVAQRVPPRAALESASMMLKKGGTYKQDNLYSFLADNGYNRTGTVREYGEFAVRGGIVDLYPAGAEFPLRLDFFGDDLETIRQFDAGNQRTVGEIDSAMLRPVGEAPLTSETIARFRQNYREAFGPAGPDDLLFESISEGRHHAGMEHWLPFYHDGLETLFDYLDEPALVLEADVPAALTERLESVADYYQARVDLMPKTAGQPSMDGSPPYKPAPMERMFLTEEEWNGYLDRRSTVVTSPFALPDATENGTSRDAGARSVIDFAAARSDPKKDLFQEVGKRLEEHNSGRLLIAAYSDGASTRLKTLFDEHSLPALEKVDTLEEALALKEGTAAFTVLELDHGFASDSLTVWTEQDILGERLSRPPRRRRRADEFISEVSSLEVGDVVVHIDHGIGRYDGLETLTVNNAPHDCLRVLYSGDDRLYVPVENIDTLSRYGSEDAAVQLDKLGGVAWQARKAKLKKRMKETADALLKVAAERELKRAEAVTPGEGAFDEFCARFAFSETDDQLRAITDVMEDMASGRAMDRLICGDVGFGKTEIALRAAFVAAMHGLQVAVVVPTTLLARQHSKNFLERFQGLPIRIEQLSRLVTGKKANEVKEGIASGDVDIVVGTHALLAKSITFKDLGLLIVDEEQHFGVGQKERLKQLKSNVHVLTLTATPIPRTLQLALTGVREMSIIATPPVDRLAVRTFVTPYDPVVVREAIQRERFRGGQVFYVCPRLADLPRVQDRLKKLLPDLKVAVAHGQMPPAQLEEVMSDFIDGKFELLLSTNIVESGLDIPSANTMIIHRSDMFGLAQLYQLRGRIGRGKIRAYCYLTLPPGQKPTESAKKRLDVLQTLDSLGAGFTLASHDLDIRGAGNLLGEEQSGHVKEVGVELYQRMLEEAVAAAKAHIDEDVDDNWSPTITLGAAVLIPDNYVTDLPVRLGLYRRLSNLQNKAELDGFAVELIDRFGALPEPVENLLKVVRIKQLCRRAGVEKVDAGPKGAVVTFRKDKFANPEGLIGFLQEQAGAAKLRPDHKLVIGKAWETPDRRLRGVSNIMVTLAKMVG